MHAAVPHKHGASLEVMPSALVQTGREQVLVEAVQTRPVVSVHVAVPHKHGALLGVVPSVSVQGSAKMQRQREG